MPENGQTIGGEQRSSDGAELQRSLNEIARCLNELTNQLHGVGPGVAAGDSVEETRPLMKALNAQFGDEGAEAWARALAETAPDEYVDHPAQDPALLQNSDASQNSDATQNAQSVVVTHSSIAADECNASPNSFNASPNSFSAAPNSFNAAPNCGSAQNFEATQDFAQRLRAHTEERSANVADFKRVMHRAIAAAQAGWQSRLDADLETATEVWTERVKGSIESSAQRAAELVAQSAQQVAQQQEQAVAERIAAMSKSFTDAGIEAETQLATVRASFEQEIKRAQELLAQVNSTASSVDDQAARLASISEIAQQELKRRGTSMLEWHSEQLVQHARQSVSEWNERLQKALETAGPAHRWQAWRGIRTATQLAAGPNSGNSGPARN